MDEAKLESLTPTKAVVNSLYKRCRSSDGRINALLSTNPNRNLWQPQVAVFDYLSGMDYY
ncbi:hypothetical protein [Levilactobacillus cerevisiae]|uniref:hypothetical protein n=1 Tax=Levilactobacillus cerevisiae TaxID=1704076 RepID=UPI000F7B647A|nr:hypothetical protein [Levilactobacillus cerevisiae]